jgi:hypothetical protein
LVPISTGVACQVIRQNILVDILKEFIEDIVQYLKVYPFRRVFLIHGLDMVADGVRDISHLAGIGPDLIEELEVDLCVSGVVEPGHEIRDSIPLLIAEVDGGEAADRHIGDFCGAIRDVHQLLHRGLGRVRPEASLPANPFGAFSGDRSLCELVAQLDFKFSTVKAGLTARFGNEELPPFLAQAVGHFIRDERRGGKYELEALDLGEL